MSPPNTNLAISLQPFPDELPRTPLYVKLEQGERDRAALTVQKKPYGGTPVKAVGRVDEMQTKTAPIHEVLWKFQENFKSSDGSCVFCDQSFLKPEAAEDHVIQTLSLNLQLV